MKLSEAIRIGATKRPQCIGDLFKDGKSCALGTAYEGLHSYDGEDVEMVEEVLFMEFPQLHESIQEVTIAKHILFMNDTKEQSREEIADWLEEKGY